MRNTKIVLALLAALAAVPEALAAGLDVEAHALSTEARVGAHAALPDLVPTIALVELLEAAQRGVIRLALPARDWVRALFSSAGFLPADLTADVILTAHGMYDIPERGDRLIAATAVSLKLPLITRDDRMTKAGVEVVW